MDPVAVLVVLFWLAIAVVATALLLDSFRKALSSDAPLPLFRKLERRGLTLDRVESEIGMAHFAGAVRRCVLCRARRQCERGEAVDCPNEELFRLTR